MQQLKLSPLIEADKIEKRVSEISAEISKKIEGEENIVAICVLKGSFVFCLLYTSPSPRDRQKSRMPSSA